MATTATGGMSENPTSATEYGPSTFFGPYLEDYLGKAQGLSNMDFTPYTGQLTAGTSNLQGKAFEGIGGLTVPTAYNAAGNVAADAAAGYGNINPSDISTNRFTTDFAQQYMNPYLQAALDPQIREAQRNAEIQRMKDASRLTQAGAFGGSRQAIMEAEGGRNLSQNLSDIVSKGYNTAYDKAADIFKSDEDRLLKAANDRARYGLDALSGQLTSAKAMSDIAGAGLSAERGIYSDQLSAGDKQREIEQQGLTADYNQYLREFNYPTEQLKAYGDAIKNTPAYTTFAYNTYGQVPGVVQNIAGGAAGAADLYDKLKKSGLNMSMDDFKKALGL